MASGHQDPDIWYSNAGPMRPQEMTTAHLVNVVGFMRRTTAQYDIDGENFDEVVAAIYPIYPKLVAELAARGLRPGRKLKNGLVEYVKKAIGVGEDVDYGAK